MSDNASWTKRNSADDGCGWPGTGGLGGCQPISLRHGVDAVAGRAMLAPADEVTSPARLREDDALECAYATVVDEIASLLTPRYWDPWPRHSEQSGASIAVTVAGYNRAGGMPAAPVAEERRFFAALDATGALVRHAPDIVVSMSGRTVGRAEGGMAETIRQWLRHADPYLDNALVAAGLAQLN